MAVEIERKFLVKLDKWHAPEHGIAIQQGYLSHDKNRAVRVRTAGDQAFLTIKGATAGISRQEFEYAIPKADADDLMKLCPDLIVKTRFSVTVGDHVWEVDVFHGANDGLVLAEIELGEEDESFVMPDWAGEEVSQDFRYFNLHLAKHPIGTWPE